MTTKTPYFYILMRTDLASMNAGKAVAQGSHAAHQFQTAMQAHRTEQPNSQLSKLYDLWLEQGVGKELGFGTAITLGVTDGSLMNAQVMAIQDAGFFASVVHDPTYPLVDGAVVHLLPLDTCAWVFGDKAELAQYLADFSLMGLCGAAVHGKHR